ncbi:uncharacterized protein [Drosophila suzukii]|uniref:Uncharacterized protein n=1 Tax=Drosophila suzukii TaxID=28584 RepID=A0ABM4TXL4_DROSZ
MVQLARLKLQHVLTALVVPLMGATQRPVLTLQHMLTALAGQCAVESVRRTDNETFEKVSPFVIKKVIDFTCGGEVQSCNKNRNGTLLIKTKGANQAYRLLKLTKFHNFTVSVTEHETLNFSKGVIYSNELRNIDELDILNELKSQKVTNIEKIRIMKNNILQESGLITVTFGSTTLPETLMIGYERVRVRPHIPRPLKCRNCLKFGHPTKFFRSPKTCSNCSAEAHTTEDTECDKPKFFINCKYDINNQFNHSPLDKTCPAFIKQKEITTIKTLQKVDHKTATRIYNMRHIHQSTPYSKITSTNQPTTTVSEAQKTASTQAPTSTSTNRQLRSYTDIMDHQPTTSSKRTVIEEMETEISSDSTTTLPKKKMTESDHAAEVVVTVSQPVRMSP